MNLEIKKWSLCLFFASELQSKPSFEFTAKEQNGLFCYLVYIVRVHLALIRFWIKQSNDTTNLHRKQCYEMMFQNDATQIAYYNNILHCYISDETQYVPIVGFNICDWVFKCDAATHSSQFPSPNSPHGSN